MFEWMEPGLHPGRSSKNWALYRIGDGVIRKRLPLVRGIVYDLGCGERPYENLFRSVCQDYIGVDWEHSLHEKKADIQADLNLPLPLASDVADTVVSFSALEHLHDPFTFSREACRLLKSGGYLILQVPFMWHVHEDPYDYFRFTRYGLRHVFDKAGFADIEVEATTGFWLMWFIKLDYQLARLIRGPEWFRRLLRPVLGAFFVVNQGIGVLLDRIWSGTEGETAGYFLTARKP